MAKALKVPGPGGASYRSKYDLIVPQSPPVKQNHTARSRSAHPNTK
jgi:hypothetical protein